MVAGDWPASKPVKPEIFSPMALPNRVESISASEIFNEFPKTPKDLRSGGSWENRYFSRTVGNKVREDLVRHYIKCHRHKPHGKQSRLF